jgi:RHS repeat-associated protein
LTSATYDAANRIATWGGTTFNYDLNGNLTSDGTTTYTWNTRNQLTSLSGGVSASFTYEGMGRRRGKTISGTTTNFLYDDLNIVQELSGTALTANLLTGLGIDETFTRAVSGGTSTVLVDSLGSTLALADASGAVQTQYTFEPFGATTVSGATTTNAQQYTGRENDGTGLYAYRARFYSPGLQRFISEDPIEFAGGDVNLYAYVGNQPTMWRDPIGLKTIYLPLPGSPCYLPPNGRKDEPPKNPLLPWWVRCSPLVIPDLLIGPLLPWWPAPLSPPANEPRPPGWDPDWPYVPRETPGDPDLPRNNPRYQDPNGPQWRWDPGHRNIPPHWDYNPWEHWNSPYQRIYPVKAV